MYGTSSAELWYESSIAQLVERTAVNRKVAGSNPAGGVLLSLPLFPPALLPLPVLHPASQSTNYSASYHITSSSPAQRRTHSRFIQVYFAISDLSIRLQPGGISLAEMYNKDHTFFKTNNLVDFMNEMYYNLPLAFLLLTSSRTFLNEEGNLL